MDKTTVECAHIYEAAKSLMDEREKDYQGSWRNEGISCAIGAAFKKASQLKTMYENGRLFENHNRSKEDILDLINYGVFAYRHLEIELIAVERRNNETSTRMPD